MRPYASGQAYQNYIDPDLTNWRPGLLRQQLPPPADVKKTYDPTRLFTFPQAIVPAAASLPSPDADARRAVADVTAVYIGCHTAASPSLTDAITARCGRSR